MPPEEHLSVEQLVGVAAGEVQGKEREAALQHLEGCAACGDRLAAVLLLRQGRATPRRRWAALVAAASVVVVAGAWMLLPQSATSPAAESLSPQRQELAARWSTFARRDNMDAYLYDFTLKILYPDVQPVAPNQHVPRTRAALVDLRDGRYDVAISQLAQLHREFPDFDSIAGWLGVALYLSGETDPLIDALLERGAQTRITLLSESSLWYGAQHQFLRGYPERAIPKLQRLAEVDDHVGRMAKAQLDELPVAEIDTLESAAGREDPPT